MQLEEIERTEKCDKKKNRPDTEPSAQGKLIEPFIKKITKLAPPDTEEDSTQVESESPVTLSKHSEIEDLPKKTL